MQLGMIGLGRMGANMVRRLMANGHDCVVYNRTLDAVDRLEGEGATGARTMDEFVQKLAPPRAAWIMVPAGVTQSVVDDLAGRLAPGDTVVDGGNSFYRDDVRRAGELGATGIDYVDVGVSGGVFGRERGFCLMIGGADGAVARLAPVFRSLAPGVEAAGRTPGRAGDPAPEEEGWLHCGQSGAGHFVKMVHNGIEYGLMAAYSEGLNILAHADAGTSARDEDAETAPFHDAEFYRYDIDTAKVTELWRRGSVVSSWLLDLTAQALQADPGLSEFGGRVSDSGEGRWTLQAAIDVGVPVDVLAAALFDRFSSQGQGDVAHRVLSAMRKGFGGHAEKPPAGEEGR
jgi:6-phosphogluconate dehydrogenase